MSNVQIMPRRDVAGPIIDALSDIQQRHHQEAVLRQQQEAQAAAIRQKEEEQKKAVLIALMSGQPFERRAGIISANPNIGSGINLPQYQPTPEEQYQRMVAQSNLQNFPQMPQSFKQAGAYQSGYGAALPKEMVDAALANDVYARPQQWDQQMQTRQQVADKILPEANKVYEQTGPVGQATAEEKRQAAIKNAAEASFTSGPKTTLTRAETGKVNAETGKVSEDTRGLKQANGMFTSATTTTPGSGDINKLSPIARMLVNRDYDPASMRRWSPAQQGAILAEVQSVDPSFSMADYPTQVATKRSFTSGEAAKSVRSINQLIGHLKALELAGKSLNNSDTLPVVTNTVANAVGGQLNRNLQRNLASYNRAADAVANETETMLRGSSSSGQGEREKMRASLGQNISPAALDGAIKTTVELMKSRLMELNDQYQKGVGRQRDFSVLNPGSRTILKSMGFDPYEMDAVGNISLDEALKKVRGK